MGVEKMVKYWHEFTNESVESFKEKAYGRYYIISSTPVRSIHNPSRKQIIYRRWRDGDFYASDIVPQAEAIVTQPIGSDPVFQTVEEQIETAKDYEATPEGKAAAQKIIDESEGNSISTKMMAVVVGLFVVFAMLIWRK